MQAVTYWNVVQRNYSLAAESTRGLVVTAFAAMVLVYSQSSLADDKFISQPKRIAKTTQVLDAPPTIALVPEPAETQKQSTEAAKPNLEAHKSIEPALPLEHAATSQDSTLTAWSSFGHPTEHSSRKPQSGQSPRSGQNGDTEPDFCLQTGEDGGLQWTKREQRKSQIPGESPQVQLGFRTSQNATNSDILRQGRLDPFGNNTVDNIRLSSNPAPTPSGSLSGANATHWQELSSPADGPFALPHGDYPTTTPNAQLLGDSPSAQRQRQPDFRLASKVSRQIIGDLDQLEEKPVAPVHLTTGWVSIGRQLSEHLRRSDMLASRGVVLSAREECQHAMLVLARHLDHLSNGFVCEPGMHVAQTALRESADFADYLLTSEDGVLKQIVHSHETPLLKQTDLRQVSPLTLAEHYRRFAERQIVQASQSHPWFSDILYHLGRTYQAEADMLANHKSDHMRGLALAYYRAALAINPTNALAANQIGYVLLQQDRPMEAQQFLVASVDVKLDIPALQNLAEASRRLGDSTMEQWSLRTLASIRNRNSTAGPVPPVQLLDNTSFIAVSPMASGPKNATQQPNMSPTLTANAHVVPSVNR